MAPDGLALFSASMSARTLARIASSEKLALPMPAWMMPVFSVRNSMAPLLVQIALGFVVVWLSRRLAADDPD